MGSMPESDQGQLMTAMIDEKALWTPNDTYLRYAPEDWESTGYRTMTWKQYANAINKVAYWLDEMLGKGTTCETIAYFGPNDPRYAILLPAVMKNERKVLVPDGRVTNEGLTALLEATDCKVWLYAVDDAGGPLFGPESGLKICALPSLEWMLDSEEQQRYPYDKTFDEAKWDEILIIHTSGTTAEYLLSLGAPKPIFHTNGMWGVVKNVPVLARKYWPRGIVYDGWIGKTNLNPCPPQWLGGLHAMIICPVVYNSPCIMLPLGEGILTPDLFIKVTKMNKVEGLRAPPQTIATLYENPETNALLKSLEFVGYLGAPLDQAIGDDLCQHTRLCSFIGSTETGDQVSIRPLDRKLWYTHDFVPENGHKMVPLDAALGGGPNGLHELVLFNTEDGRPSPFQLAFWNSRHRYLKSVETKELYTPVKDIDGHVRWAFSSRKDDLTKLSWLAKFHASDIESRIMQHVDVRSVCVGGEGRQAPWVIIDPKEGVLDQKSEAQLLRELYEGVITRTNKSDIEEISIPRQTVLIAKKEKPFTFSLKQLVQRRAVEKDYAEEIEQAYLLLSEAGKV